MQTFIIIGIYVLSVRKPFNESLKFHSGDITENTKTIILLKFFFS